MPYCSALRCVWIACSCALCLFLQACGTAGDIDLGREYVLDTALNSVDLGAAADAMARDIAAKVSQGGKPVVIGFIRMDNHTSEYDFDSYNLLSKIRELLLEDSKGALRFADRARMRQFMAKRGWLELNAERSGEMAKLLGIDYFLTGDAFEMSEKKGNEHEVYYRLSFRLTSGSGEVLWQNSYEVKRYVAGD